jgi:hypothetical protein
LTGGSAPPGQVVDIGDNESDPLLQNTINPGFIEHKDHQEYPAFA